MKEKVSFPNCCAIFSRSPDAAMKRGPDKGERKDIKAGFVFLTDLPVSRKNAPALVEAGRRLWKIENEGFNTQKRHGYHLEHLFSRNCQAVKNHYFLMQIGHMLSQVMEAWKKLAIACIYLSFWV